MTCCQNITGASSSATCATSSVKAYQSKHISFDNGVKLLLLTSGPQVPCSSHIATTCCQNITGALPATKAASLVKAYQLGQQHIKAYQSISKHISFDNREQPFSADPIGGQLRDQSGHSYHLSAMTSGLKCNCIVSHLCSAPNYQSRHIN